MNVSIVIPNYNGERLLKKNLPQVLEAAEFYQEKTGSKIEVIIVDDGSTDFSESVISNFLAERDLASQDKSQKLEIIFLQNEKNLGFASTVNRGVKESKGVIVVLLNTDVAPEENFLIPLIDHFKDPQVFAVGCMDKSVEGGKEILRGRGIGFWKRGFLIHSRGGVNKNNTLWVNGGSGAFKKNIWEKLGGLNTIYSPFYWEDIDLSYRALKSGYKIFFEPKSVVVHEHSIGAIKSKYSVSEIKKIAYRNQFIFSWINATDIDILFSQFVWLPYHLLKAISKVDLYLLSGFFRAFILFPEIIKSKFKARVLFIKKDSDVIASVNEAIF